MRLGKMRAILVIAGIVLALALWGCAPPSASLLDYQEGERRVRLVGEMNGVAFSATLTLDKMPEGDAPRSFELLMESPESLGGITFRRGGEGDGIVAELDGIEVELSEGVSVAAIADAFSVSEEPRAISSVRGADVGAVQSERLTKLEFERLTVYVDAKSGLPVKMESSPAARESSENVFSFFVEPIDAS